MVHRGAAAKGGSGMWSLQGWNSLLRSVFESVVFERSGLRTTGDAFFVFLLLGPGFNFKTRLFPSILSWTSRLECISGNSLGLRTPLICLYRFRLAQRLEALAAVPQVTGVLSELYKLFFGEQRHPFELADPQPCFIAKLSPELLSEIFVLYCQGKLSSASVIASVCTQWRDLIIDESRLWVSKMSVDVDDLNDLCATADIHSPSVLLSTALRRWEGFKLDFRFAVTHSRELRKRELGMSLFSALLDHGRRWRSVSLIVDPPASDSLKPFTFQSAGSKEDSQAGLVYMLVITVSDTPNLTSLSVATYPHHCNLLRESPNAFSRLTHFEAQRCALSSFVVILSAARASLVSCSVTAFVAVVNVPFLPAEAFTLPNLEALTLPYPNSQSLFYIPLLTSFFAPQLKKMTFCGHFSRVGGEMEVIKRLIMKSGCRVEKLQLPPGASMADLEFARSELAGILSITLTDPDYR
ncbi:hypothetical protein E1B28_010748 [Marasmius oreades]|uniref:F-box domain-containing protein n=1 Tax=Marasmius oreades TaxID=181124 RepID=A0A9P7RU16_9AGAR|nr:uncharacterized protein E1B28_010748 [Marasmius oreades]KAG7089038.1 hypothetical protein E1B28_010748 [Marasmius oreades]